LSPEQLPISEPVKQPLNRLPGTKIADSPFADEVMKLLLLRKGYAPCLRFLETNNYKVSLQTLKDFELNFVSKLAQDLRDKIIVEAKAEEAKRNEMIVSQVSHAQVSRAESLITLIKDTENQLAVLNGNPEPSAYQDHLKKECRDAILYYRGQLEKVRIESEVELERGRAIEAVAAIALEYMKGRPEDADRFIERVAELQDRSAPA